MSKNIQVLSSLESSFVYNQTAVLAKMADFSLDLAFLINGYGWLRKRERRQSIAFAKKNRQNGYHSLNYIFYPGLPKNIGDDWLDSFAIPAAAAKLKRNRPHLIHAHGLYLAGYAGLKLARKWNIPLVVTTHGADFYQCFPPEPGKTRFKQHSAEKIAKIKEVLASAQRIIAVSQRFAEDVRNFSAQANVVSIENSYRTDLFFQSNKMEARNRLALPVDAPILLAVGLFVPKKGHRFLIDAMPAVLEKFPKAKLYIVGGGMLKAELETFIKMKKLTKSIHLINNIPQSQLPDWYRSADVYCMPSLNEPFGIALVEAMACGVPPIATQTQGPSQIILDNETGFLLPAEDSNAFSNKILELLENPDRRQQMGQKAAADVGQKYAFQEEKIAALYRKILGM